MVEAVSPRFWLLRSPAAQQRVEKDGADYEPVICPAREGHRRIGKRIGELSIVVPPSGVKDFTWVWGRELLISQRVLHLFDQHHVTGFEVKPAKVSFSTASKTQPPDLFELVVSGWGGLAAPAAGASLVESCPACGFKQYAIAEPSLLIDPAAWDGSDLFFVWPLPGYRFASDRLAGILRQEGVSGLELIPAAEIPMKRGGTASPGSLARLMRESRARELEQRFGVSHWLVKTSRWRWH
jgi:hypothetical protein